MGRFKGGFKENLKRKAQCLQSERGFSLAEVLATVAILIILFALVAINVVNWQASIRQKEMDSKAQTIYVTAQEQMSTIMAAGQESLLQPLGKGGAQGNGVTLFPGVPADSGLGDNEEVEVDSIAYVTSQDLDTQLADDNSAVHALFYSGNLDEDLLHHNWVIEYDYTNLTVYAVFYSEDDTYDCATGYSPDADNDYNAYYRDHDMRLKNTRGHVGYHNGAGSTGSNSYELNPTIVVTNGEELTAQIKCTAPSLAARDLVFKVTVEDEFGHRYAKYYTFNNEFTRGSGDTLEINSTVWNSNTSTSLRGDDGAVPLKRGMIYELDLTLDSLIKSDWRFSKLYGSNSGHDNSTNGNSNLVEGANLSVSVEVFCPSNQQVTHAVATTSTTSNPYPNNSLYGDQDGGTHINYNGTAVVIADKGTANISCGRHLQNLDASSNIGAGVTSASLGSSTVDFGNLKNADENDWISTYGKTAGSSTDDSGDQEANTYFNGTDANGLPLFKPIQNSSLTKLDGKSVSATDEVAAYGVISGLNIDTANDKDADAPAAGLFAGSSATELSLANLRLSGAKVSGGDSASAGVLVGQLAGGNGVSIDNCQVYLQQQTDFTAGDKDAYKTVWVKGSVAGGLVGTVTDDSSLAINRSSASTVIGDKALVTAVDGNAVSSSVVAGGLVGSVESGNVSVNASYADCYLYGKDTAGLVGTVADGANVTLTNAYAAGFMAATHQTAGLAGGTVTDASAKCYTAMSTLDKSKATSSITTTSGAADGRFMVANQGNAKAILSYLNNDSGEFTLDQSSQSAPYNLMGQALDSYEWPTVTDLRHYGDWVAGFEEGALVYYEEYQRGTSGGSYYGFHGANVESTLDSRASDDDSSIHVVGDGYGVVYLQDQKPTTQITVTVTNPNGGGAVGTVTINPNTATCYTVTGTDGIKYVVYPLDKDVVNTATVNNNGYYLKAQITHEESGATADPVYYAFNPHFAKTVKKLASQSDFPVISNDPLVEVRTARQLWNLSAYYDGYFKITESGIAKGKQISFTQGRNIDYEEYKWGTYTTLSSSQYSNGVTQTPVGASTSVPFKDIYDGNNYEITNVGFTSTADEQLAGMFGCVGSSGQVRNTVLRVNYSPTKTNKYSVSYNVKSENLSNVSLGVLAGKNEGRIANCSVSGYYIAGSKGTLHVYKNSKVDVGGLVGANSGTIRNCSADTPKLDLSLQYATVNAGGFVGKNASGGKIQDSYAVGAIAIKESKESAVSMAGFAGKNESQISSSYCATALTASGSDTTLAAFAPKGGSVTSCYYLDGGTYSYIGKMYAYLFDATDTAGTRATYQTMQDKASSAKVTVANSLNHPNTASEKDGLNIAYPFAGTVKDSDGSRVHYGDWPVEESMGSLGVFYWEKETGNNGGYHMTYLGTEFDDNGNLIPVKGTTLCTAHDDGGIITEYGYGYYVAKGEQDSLKATWSDISTSGDVVNTTASLDLASQMNSGSASSGSSYQYVFYAYTTQTDKAAGDGEDYIYLSGGSDVQNGSLTLSYKAASSNKTQTYKYTVSPFFGNAMSVDSVTGSAPASKSYLVEDESGYQTDFTDNEPGKSQTTLSGSTVTAGNAYEVRSVDQLQYINWNGTSKSANDLITSSNYKQFNYLPYANATGQTKKGKSIVDTKVWNSRVERFWTQTHDAEPTEKQNFTPIAGTLESSSYDSYDAVMYAWFGATYNGQSYTVKNLEISTTSFNVGLFGTTVGASLSNIIMYGDSGSIHTIKRDAGGNKTGAYSIGGLVGVAYDYDTANPSTIQNCAISGYTINDSSDNRLGLGEINIGGLIGVSNTNLTRCSAVTDIELNEESLFASDKPAAYGVFVRVGGLTGATQATLNNCYSGGSLGISKAMQTNAIKFSENYSKYQIYVGGIAGSGFTSNYKNFTNNSGVLDGNPVVKNCYTYFDFPTASFGDNTGNSGKFLVSFATVSISDRVGAAGNSIKATIDNCYYYAPNTQGRTNFKAVYNGSNSYRTSGTPTAMSYTDMANATAFAAMLNGSQGNIWGQVTTIDQNQVEIDGKYSFPSSSVLEGKNYPFPTVLHQNDLTFGSYSSPVEVNVHYGDWPINDSHWALGRDSVDIFEDMDEAASTADDPWTYKTAELRVKGDDITALDNALARGDAAVKALFTFNNGQGSTYASTSSLVDIDSVTLSQAAASDDGYAVYDVKFKIKQDGVVNVRFNGKEFATFTLQITADLEVSAALSSGDDPDVFDQETNTLKISVDSQKRLNLISACAATDAAGNKLRDYSVRTTWSADPTIDPDGASNADYNGTNLNTIKTVMTVRRDMSEASTVTTTATYVYHTGEGGKTYTKDLVINVTGPDVVGLSNGTTFNEAPTAATGTALTGVDTNYDQGSQPSFALDGTTSNMFLYASASSGYLTNLDVARSAVSITDIAIDGTSGYKNGEYDKDKQYYINIGGDVTTDADARFNYLSGLLSFNGDEAPNKDIAVKLTFSDGHVLATTIAAENIPATKLVTITFDSNGSSLVDAAAKQVTKRVVANANLTLQEPSKIFELASGVSAEAVDKSFDYWQTADGTATYNANASYKLAADITLKAVWKHTLTLVATSDAYHSMTTSVPAAGISQVADYSNIEDETTVDNWAFDGWYDSTNEKTAKRVLDTNGNVVSKDIDGAGYKAADGNLTLSADVTLYAKWNRWQPVDSLEDGKRYVFSENKNQGDNKKIPAMTNEVLIQSNANGATIYKTSSQGVSIKNVSNVSTIVSHVDDNAIWLAGEHKVSDVSVARYDWWWETISFDGTYYTLQDQEFGYFMTDSGTNDIVGGIGDIDKGEAYSSAHSNAARSYFCVEYYSGRYGYLLRSYNKINWSSSGGSVGNRLYLGFGSNSYPSYYETFGNALYPYGEQVTFNPNNLSDHTLTLKNGSGSTATTAFTAAIPATGATSLSGYAAPQGSDGWELDGWYDSANDSAKKVLNADGTFASSSLSFNGGTISGGNFALGSNTTLYAKWKKTVTSGYQKVDDVADGDYLLGIETSAGSYTLLQYATKGSEVSSLSNIAGVDGYIADATPASGSGALWTLKTNSQGYLSIVAKDHTATSAEYLDVNSSGDVILSTSNQSSYVWTIADGSYLLNWEADNAKYRYVYASSSAWKGSDTLSSSTSASVSNQNPAPAKFVFFKKMSSGESKTIYSWDKH